MKTGLTFQLRVVRGIPFRGPGSLRVIAVLALWGVLLPAVSWAGLGDSQIPLVDGEACFQIGKAKELFAEERYAEGIVQLQRLHEKLWGRNALFTDESLRKQDHIVSVAATGYIRQLLLALPSEAREIYRDQFDLVAQALWDRGLERRDTDDLVRCYELYPISTVGSRAALAAGDIFFERGQPLRAEECWNAIPTSDEGASPEMVRERARRGMLLASHRGDRAAYQDWQAIAGGGPGAPPAPATAPEADLLADLPVLPFRSARIEWETFPYKGDSYDDLNYVQRACVGDRWVSVFTLKKLIKYDLETGKQLHSKPFPPPANFPYYEERDAFLRLEPVSDGETIVTSFVHSANLPEEFYGYDIKIAIPHRALQGAATSMLNPVWKTSSPRMPRGQTPSPGERGRVDLLKQLSFNSRPVIHDGRLYALGWRQAGYVISYLVCLELKTGRPEWITILSGNQIELTMFGEMALEPFLGALEVKDGTIYASTNLGAVASVRARDGAVNWITEYPAIEAQRAHRSRGTSSRRATFERNPLILFEDRLLVSPFDSDFVLAIRQKDGTLLQNQRGGRLGSFMIGLHGEHVVFCGSRLSGSKRVRLRAARDLGTDAGLFTLANGLSARPAIVRGGLVYSYAGGGLNFLSFSSQKEEVLFPAEVRSRRRNTYGTGATDGSVEVLEKRILVTNSYKVRSYETKIRPNGREPK